MHRSPSWPQPLQAVPTADGSWTCRDLESGELFHNAAGAWTEAQHHYAEPFVAGRQEPLPETVRLFDACFGLGYASWALIERLTGLENAPQRIEVDAYETQADLACLWPRVLDQPMLAVLRSMRATFPAAPRLGTARVWKGIVRNVEIEMRLYCSDFRSALANGEPSYDGILHDPFTPMRAAHLWTQDLFERYRAWLLPRHGRLATYSTSMAVLGGLLGAGFSIYRTPQLGKKRGGTLATPAPLPGPLPAGWGTLPPDDAAALQTRSGLPYRDATLKGLSTSLIRARNEEQRRSALPQRTVLGP